VRETQELPAGRGQGVALVAIALEGVAVLVVGPAVELDGPLAELAAAEGVDASVQPDEVRGLDPHLDHRPREPELRELLPSHHPVLPLGKRRERHSGHLRVCGTHR
jgi:hypothetical protein